MAERTLNGALKTTDVQFWGECHAFELLLFALSLFVNLLLGGRKGVFSGLEKESSAKQKVCE